MKKVTFLLPDMKVGGVQRVNSVISENLSNFYETNILITQHKNVEFNTSIPCDVVENYSKAEDYFLRLLKRSPMNVDSVESIFNKRLVRKIIINMRKNNTDTIIVNADLILQIPLLKKYAPEIKIIAWVHNNIDIYMEKYFSEKRELLIKSLELADVVICLTEFDLIKIKKINKNTICIFNPVTLENNETSSLNTQTILCVARYSIEHKGLDYLIEIASKLPTNWKIKLVGSGNAAEREEVMRLVENWDAQNKIELCGNLHGDELKNCYKESSIYLMTSRWEGFPLVLAEAMSFGLPVVAFEQTGSKQVLQNGEFGIIIEQGKIDRMLESLIDLIEDPEKLKELSALSLNRVEEFQINKILNQWKDLLNQLN